MMQRSAGNDIAARIPTGFRSAQLGPTALDHLLDRAQRVAPQLMRVSDLLMIIVAVALTLVDLAVWATDPVVATGRLTFSLAFLVPCLGVLATGAIAVRRRHLSVALLALAGVAIALTVVSWAIGTSIPPSFAVLFALALLTNVALRRAPGRAALLLASIAGLAVAAEALRPMVSTAGYLLLVCESAFAVAAGVGVYLRFTDWRRVAAADAARADERLEIAREVHDLVGHYVTAIVVQAQAARHVAGHQPTAAAAALQSIETAGADALIAMRRMVGGMRDDSPRTPSATWDDIDGLIANAVTQGQPVRATIGSDVRKAAPALAPAVHRIIAESLTNVRRHAHGVTSIDVAVVSHDNVLVLTVRDDGEAVGPIGHDTYGIVGMSERASSLGGSLSAGPAPGGGWIVRAELPVEHVR